MIRPALIPLRGGLDTETPAEELAPGQLIGAQNYCAALEGGYRRSMGLERFNGRTSPTAAGEAEAFGDDAARSAARDAARAAITAVPGGGGIRGVVLYNGVVYAIRDNSIQSAAVWHKSTSSGWSAIPEVDLPAQAAGGSYKFQIHNFLGHAGSRRLYAVDGKNKALETNGTTFSPITTGMTVDTPHLLAAHQNHLFLGFRGGSLQHSAVGDPFSWTAVLGAAELGIGDEMTGLASLAGEADSGMLSVFSRNSTQKLYGNGPSTWVLRQHVGQVGALPHTLSPMGEQPYYLDDRGLTTLGATQAHGDLVVNTISQHFQRWLATRMHLATASVTVKSLSQYRIYFSNGEALYVTVDRRGRISVCPQKLPWTITAAWAGEDTDGKERIFLGASNGFVYEERGESFDGDPIEAFIRLPYHSYGNSALIKRFRRMTLTLDGRDPIELRFYPSFDYDDPERPLPAETELTVGGVGGLWDVDNWDEFYWSSPAVATAHAGLRGSGINLGLLIYSESAIARPYTLQSLTVHYEPRRLRR